MEYVWPREGPRPGSGPPEDFVLFETDGGRELTLASNCPYEVWLDGVFAGDGGHRSVAGEAPRDSWPSAREARRVTVRVHWIDGERTTLYVRRAHADPFLAVEEAAAWTAHRDASIVATPTKASGQLPRQNVASGRPTPGLALALGAASLACDWACVDFGIARPRVVPVAPREIGRLVGDRVPATDGRGAVGAFDPCAASDLAADPIAWSRDGLPRGVACTSLDLGRIALHRVEVDAPRGPCALAWSEVPSFAETWASSNRIDVRLVDAVPAGAVSAAPFGWRGGRYLHVLHRGDAAPVLRVWRREYPLTWREVAAADPRDSVILDACRANLVACVDGGLVDTCWRERGQWTGDVRMSAAAVRALTRNDEVVTLALRQIAASYDERTAMVQGVWPASPPGGRPVWIPGYHLAFCLAVSEHGEERVPELATLARASLEAWRARYAKGGLLDGFPDGCWWFVDWDPSRRRPKGVPSSPDDPAGVGAPDAVTHAWLEEACCAFGVASPIDAGAFERAFWNGTAYRLRPEGTESPQASAAAVLAYPRSAHAESAVAWLLAQHAAGQIDARCTPYFATFVARAVGTRSADAMRALVRDLYHPRAARWGTIPEKTTDAASLAHGWSVGVAPLLVV